MKALPGDEGVLPKAASIGLGRQADGDPARDGRMQKISRQMKRSWSKILNRTRQEQEGRFSEFII